MEPPEERPAAAGDSHRAPVFPHYPAADIARENLNLLGDAASQQLLHVIVQTPGFSAKEVAQAATILGGTDPDISGRDRTALAQECAPHNLHMQASDVRKVFKDQPYLLDLSTTDQLSKQTYPVPQMLSSQIATDSSSSYHFDVRGKDVLVNVSAIKISGNGTTKNFTLKVNGQNLFFLINPFRMLSGQTSPPPPQLHFWQQQWQAYQSKV